MFPINILLVDDHALFSKSLEIALSDYPEITSFKSVNNISLLDSFLAEKLVSFLSQISQGAVIFNRNIPFLEELTECENISCVLLLVA